MVRRVGTKHRYITISSKTVLLENKNECIGHIAEATDQRKPGLNTEKGSTSLNVQEVPKNNHGQEWSVEADENAGRYNMKLTSENSDIAKTWKRIYRKQKKWLPLGISTVALTTFASPDMLRKRSDILGTAKSERDLSTTGNVVCSWLWDWSWDHFVVDIGSRALTL